MLKEGQGESTVKGFYCEEHVFVGVFECGHAQGAAGVLLGAEGLVTLEV